MHAILNVVLEPRNLYKFVVVGVAVPSWLIAYLRPIPKFLPNLGGIDISPVVLLLGIILSIYTNIF